MESRPDTPHNCTPGGIFWHERVMKMFKGTVLCINRSEAVRHAANYLSNLGVCVTEKSGPDITHLLLPVPSFPAGDTYLAHYLTEVPDEVIVSGGNLTSPLLEHYRTVDFLRDPYYLAENAAITADCALKLVEEKLTELSGKRVLVLGWGRIGKCLGQHLSRAGAEVTIAARKTADLAMIQALGCQSLPIHQVRDILHRCDAILNTVPELILPQIEAKPDCLILELASRPGMTGKNIIPARGLPGKMAPERSGALMARTFIRLSL